MFNDFNETIFLKEDSDLEKQLQKLKSIREKLENTDEIDKDIKILEYGIKGENEIAFELKNANIGMYVLHDVTFKCEGNKVQIDYMILTRGNTYLIECKNLYGNITVDDQGQFYREYEYNGKKIKEAIYSPYTQAVRHKDIIIKVWNANHSGLSKFLFKLSHSDDIYKSMVVLANSKSFLNTRYAPKKIKNVTIRADQLVSYIKKDIEKKGTFELCSKSRLKKNAEIWLSRCIQNDTDISNKYLKEFKINELKKYRKEKSEKMNIPEDYIFTDEEMEKILDLMPKNINDLKRSNILSDIKNKYHGEEIISVLNNKII